MEWTIISVLALVVSLLSLWNTFNKQTYKKGEDKGGLEEWQKTVNAFMGRIETKIDGFSQELGNFKQHVAENYLNKKDQVSTAGSPLELTDKGRKLADDSGITNLIERRLETYKSKLEGVQLPSEIFLRCTEMSEQEFDFADKDIKEIIKQLYDAGINQREMQEIFTLKLRDIYMESLEETKDQL